VSPTRLPPERVIPAELARAVGDVPYWFVIGGHAVRCFCPYRPSRDVDFGVRAATDLDDLLAQLSRTGAVDLGYRSQDTAHLRWNGINVSVFVLPFLAPFVADRALDVTAVLATKLHAILDRGTRRDFFDLYVALQHHQLGIVECLRAIRTVYRRDVNDGVLLRALTYFDDAEREAPLPGEGPRDWSTVKDYLLINVGSLLVPPPAALAIQARIVDVVDDPTAAGGESRPRRRRR
jgi:nucleotidyltransferase AbiEii toxin of type IV toxin-antitoxin system